MGAITQLSSFSRSDWFSPAATHIAKLYAGWCAKNLNAQLCQSLYKC